MCAQEVVLLPLFRSLPLYMSLICQILYSSVYLIRGLVKILLTKSIISCGKTFRKCTADSGNLKITGSCSICCSQLNQIHVDSNECYVKSFLQSKIQWWNITISIYTYSCSVLEYNYVFKCFDLFPFSVTLYFYSTTFQRDILYCTFDSCYSRLFRYRKKT